MAAPVVSNEFVVPEDRQQSFAAPRFRRSAEEDNNKNTGPFQLEDSFIERYAEKQPVWGPLGYITYKRTYARPLESVPLRYQALAKLHGIQESEEWWLTVLRVVEGTYRIQQKHCYNLHLPWRASKAQASAQEMYRLIFEMKFLPPGRGLWMMGCDYVDRAGGAALNNCAYVSTAELSTAFSSPFVFLMDMSMLGVGVGGDTRGAGTVNIVEPLLGPVHVVEDSREGWVDLIRRCLDAFVGKDSWPEDIDYSAVRPSGAPIRGFGGTAAGHEPLAELVAGIRKILTPRIGYPIASEDIVDLFNMIGRCVVAGNVRRSAEIMFGNPDDKTFLELKDPSKNGEALASHRWASNNSVFARVGQDYTVVAELTAKNGEPGYEWLDNARAYSRMGRPADNKDQAAMGGNPCLEQTLESYELCCLVESFPSRHESYDEYERTLKYAYLYAKTVTLVPTHDARTNAVMLRNRRIGTSMSGIVQAMQRHGRRKFFDWCDSGYEYLQRLDDVYSKWLCVPKSIKITSVKPSGTTSLLPGVTPGIHFPHSQFYFRVIRFATGSPLVKALAAAGFRCVDLSPGSGEGTNEPNTTAVYFAVKEPFFDRAKSDVSIWEQLEIAAQMQQYWADNQVSVTITFKPEEAKDIKYALELYETRLKGVSFLPLTEHGYKHAPYQTITEEDYERYQATVRPLDLNQAVNDTLDRFCDGDSCQIRPKSS